MICKTQVKKFCCEDISNIVNYDLAMSDTTQTWCCHHRDEVKVLPSGVTVIRSRQDLKDNGRYFGCPANELIFLTKSEHMKLHMSGKPLSDEHKKKLSAAHKGKTLSNEHKKKISQAISGEKNPWYGKKHSEETKKKISEAKKGKTRTLSDEHKKKIAEARKKYWAKQKAISLTGESLQ